MTTYNTYQEAKIAMPLACIIEDTDSGLFFGMPTREGTTLAGGSRFAEPQYYCISMLTFSELGHKLVDGDVYQNEDGRVFTVGRLGYEARYCNLLSSYCLPSKVFILRAAALENQMNIDNLATQTPEEKEVEWVNGLPPIGVECDAVFIEHEHKGYGEFLVLGYHDNYVWMEYTGELSNKLKHYTAKVDMVKFRKPETEAERVERERLEAAEDLYITYMSKWEFAQDWRALDEINKSAFLAIVDKTNYRKESN